MPRQLLQRLAALLVVSLSSCGPPDAPSDCGGMCEPAGALYPGVGECVDATCTPTYIPCVEKGEVETCAEACTAQATTCAENGCGGYTYAIYAVVEWCQDPERGGVTLPHACDEPIDWQFNESVKCCCEQT